MRKYQNIFISKHGEPQQVLQTTACHEVSGQIISYAFATRLTATAHRNRSRAVQKKVLFTGTYRAEMASG